MPTSGQRALAETYRDAAGQRIVTAFELYDAGHLVESNYLAGLAVECILRAYRTMIDPEFDSRHDIDKLYTLAKFGDLIPSSRADSFNASLGIVVACWSNDHRFLTEPALRKRWTRRGLFKHKDRWVRGNLVKELTRQLVNAGGEIVNVGVARWKNSFEN